MEFQQIVKRDFSKSNPLNRYFLLFILISFVVILLTVIYGTFFNQIHVRKVFIVEDSNTYIYENSIEQEHSIVVEKFYEEKSEIEFSDLGKILYLNEPRPAPRHKRFKILIWKYGKALERRHLRYFQNNTHDPFEGCSVNNCFITYKDEDIVDADAVVFLLIGIKNINHFPVKKRPINQRWIFLSDESPKHTFLPSSENEFSDYANLFNWSMTYRAESDIPVPYGRVMPLESSIKKTIPILDLIPHGYQKRRDILVAVMISDCTGERMKILKELQKHIKVDVYGSCGTKLKNACPGHFSADCPHLNNYLFYLAFENSKCEEYMTEKLFWNAYSKGAIPIILGSTKKNCEMFLPPNSYLHTDGYARPADLARHLYYLNNSWHEDFFQFHQWRRHFQIVNEHGYFGSKSVHYCRICEALNYNAMYTEEYEDLSYFLSVEKNCDLPQKTTTETNLIQFFFSHFNSTGTDEMPT